MKDIISRLVIISISFLSLSLLSQELSISKVEPPNWWVGMKTNKIQLMVYGENLNNISATFNNDKLVVDKIYEAENPSFTFIDVIIQPGLSPGTYKLNIANEISGSSINFPVLKRNNAEGRHQGFDQTDVIYLITPDRFCDGDTTNNIVEGYINEYNRDDPYGRHGGDIQGIINKLDYLCDLGITAIWINPLVENNTSISYHGYAATDFYKIDPRFGTNQLYTELVDKAYQKEIKVILDHVSNHISIDHPWMNNLPAEDWIHGSAENHIIAEHHKMAYFDLYADSSTVKHLSEGWFTDHMPDLNQENPLVANYIIQNTIWWIETTGLDGIREDTYPYADQEFLSKWAEVIFNEYPNLNIVGEVWSYSPSLLATYQGNSYMPRNFGSKLPSVTDFAMRDALYNFLSGSNDLYNVYDVFSKDYIYPSPEKLVTFIDNHDIERIMYGAGGDIDKAKIALTILLTSRGIPQIYYATEIGMIGGDEHGIIRTDFPGGFPGDKRNAFLEDERTETENDIFNFTKKLLHIRKTNPALNSGQLIHFPPVGGIYVYFKISGKNKFMIAVNENEYAKELPLNRIKKHVEDAENITDLLSGKEIPVESLDEFMINAKRSYIFEIN